MIAIVAGSRYLTDYAFVKSCIEGSGINITEVIAGGAKGVDTLAEKWAKEMRIPCKVVQADWKANGKKAGPMRNKVMAKVGQVLIAIKISTDPCIGTCNMIECAKNQGLQVLEFVYEPSI